MTVSAERPVALVTGAGRGIGAAVSHQLADRGHVVLAAARAPSDGDGSVVPLPLDVTDPGSVHRAVDTVATEHGRLDVLVNNAAAFVDWSEAASTADLEASRAVMETNLYGAWRVTQAFLPLLRRSSHPRIVMVSSGAGSHADDSFGLGARAGAAASYGISKAALNALVTTLAAELAGSGVLVNAVCPGLTATWPGAEQMGARPVEEGAAGVTWAATLPDDGPTGGFFRDRAELGW
jgi:NAD(P)-dependent dehydrogenase (short-subunit alcohol dehydrogenase family)